MSWEVVDRKTGKIVAICKTRNGANRSADRRDNAYGAYRYTVREKEIKIVPVFFCIGLTIGPK